MSKKAPKRPVTPKQKVPVQVWVALIGLAGIVIVALINLAGQTRSVDRTIHATETAEARLTALAPQVASPTEAPKFVGYDFEEDIQGWQTTEGASKLATLNTTSLTAYHGKQSLVLNTELYGSGSAEYANHGSGDVYRHTEAVVYFDQIPTGMDVPGPYDLTGKRLACFVYLPAGLIAPKDGPPAYARLFVKDKAFANLYSEPRMITQDNTEKWLELILVVRADPNAGFDTTQVNALGVRLDSLDNSTVSYNGPLYIDDCTIGS